MFCFLFMFYLAFVLFFFFFFKQKTAFEMRISDWSSDVCSSDLSRAGTRPATRDPRRQRSSRARTACRDRRLARVTGGPEQTLGGSRTPSAARTARRLHPGADGSRRLGLHPAIATLPAMSDQLGLCGPPGDRTSVVEGRSVCDRVD